MCTLISLWRMVDGYDIVVGMNRDESASRPSEPPAFIDGDPPIVAPRDRKAGGTWIGTNGHGLVLALSNRQGRNSETARSRGLLLLDALRLPDVRSVGVFLEREVAAREYNYWHLMAASRKELRFFTYDGEVSSLRGREGLNVLTNEGVNEGAGPKLETIRQCLRGTDFSSVDDAVRALESTLRAHGDNRVPLCVHGLGGGTVSSTILALSNGNPQENVLLYAEGPPCSAPYRDRHEILRHLAHAT